MKVQLYVKVFEDIFSKIKSNYYEPGDMLPSEQEMETMYGVSRAPIRQALGKLESDGLIKRRPGKGTFVTNSSLHRSKVTMGGFGTQFSSKWEQIKHKTISVETIQADDKIAYLLGLHVGDHLIQTTRVRYVNDEPVFLLKHYSHKVDREYIQSQKDFTNMREILEEHYNYEIVYVKEDITAITADTSLVDILQLDSDSSLLHLERVSYDQNYKPIEYVDYYVKPGEWNYKIMYHKESESTSF